MIDITLSDRPELLRLDIEPTERRPRRIDLSARLASGETLDSASVADGGRGVASNVAVDGSAVTLDVAGLVNGTVSVLIVTALGDAGSIIRCALLVRCVDPVASGAPVIVPPTGALIMRGEYVAEGVYRQYDVVTVAATLWLSLLDAPQQAPGVDGAEWLSLTGAGLDPGILAEIAANTAARHLSGSDAETVTSMGALTNAGESLAGLEPNDKIGVRKFINGLWASITYANFLLALRTAFDAVYVLAGGKAGGQTINGGTAADEVLTLRGSAEANKGTVSVPGNIEMTGTMARVVNLGIGRTQDAGVNCVIKASDAAGDFFELQSHRDEDGDGVFGIVAKWDRVRSYFRFFSALFAVEEGLLPTIITATATIDWTKGHVTFNVADNVAILAWTNVPQVGVNRLYASRSYLTVRVMHNGGIRTLSVPAGTLGTITTSGTSGGWDVHTFVCDGDGIVRVGSFS